MAAQPPPLCPPIEREGITILYGDETGTVDIVILHGLNGDPEKTWTHESQFFWPWELRSHIKNARVMVFGYNADVAQGVSDNLIRIKDIARKLLGDLVVERQEDEERNRPIIFMGHSLGGLVIKQTILLASQELHNEASDKRLIYNSIKGLFFFGTPHLGSSAGAATRVQVLKGIAKVVLVKVPPKLDSALRLHSDELGDLTDDFKRTSLWLEKKFEIYTYYESITSAKLGALVVDETSAKTGYDRENVQPIQADHEGMVKFVSAKDGNFRSVCGNIKGLMRREPSNAQIKTNAKFQASSYAACSMEPVRTFVQRTALLDKVREQLTRQPEGSQKAVRKVGIWGAGGAGKSQLARAYLQQYGDQYDATFWIHAVSLSTLDKSFQDIYHTLPDPPNLPPDATTQNIRVAVLRWFDQHPGKWLIIFDEADHLQEKDKNYTPLSEYIPNGVHAIITSRSKIARDLSTFEGVEIGKLEPLEAVDLFLKYANLKGASDEKRVQAGLIAEELGHYALALSIAGSYVSRKPRLTADLPQYLKEHRDRRALLHQEPQQLINMYNRSLVATWETSYQAVYDQLPDACRVFDLLGFLGNEDIYIDLFHLEEESPWPLIGESESKNIDPGESALRVGPWQRSLDGIRDDILACTSENNNVEVQRTLDCLLRQQWQTIAGLQSSNTDNIEESFSVLEEYSMIQRDASKGTYSMHSLVHAWSRHRLQVKHPQDFNQKSFAILRLLMAAVSRIRPLEPGDSDTKRNRQMALQLVPHLRDGLQAATQPLADTIPMFMFKLLSHLCNVLYYLDCFRDWSSVREMAFQTAKALLGEQHPQTISAMIEYGYSLVFVGALDGAEGVLSDALGRAQSINNDRLQERCFQNLSICVKMKSDYAKCRRYITETLAKQESELAHLRDTLAQILESQSSLDTGISNTRECVERAGHLSPKAELLQQQSLEAALQTRSKLPEVLACTRHIIQEYEQSLAETREALILQPLGTWDNLLTASKDMEATGKRISAEVGGLALLTAEWNASISAAVSLQEQSLAEGYEGFSWRSFKQFIKDVKDGKI